MTQVYAKYVMPLSSKHATQNKYKIKIVESKEKNNHKNTVVAIKR